MKETDIDHYIQKIVADNGKLAIAFSGIGIRPIESDYGIYTTQISFE